MKTPLCFVIFVSVFYQITFPGTVLGNSIETSFEEKYAIWRNEAKRCEEAKEEIIRPYFLDSYKQMVGFGVRALPIILKLAESDARLFGVVQDIAKIKSTPEDYDRWAIPEPNLPLGRIDMVVFPHFQRKRQTSFGINLQSNAFTH
ncbi:MAG: hypothetical protein WA705_19880 [Candidatus Ozemobacteraceae bacterium]